MGCGFVCDAGFRDCGGACRDTAVDVANCGSCGHLCTGTSHGTPACRAGLCEVACDPGFAAGAGGCIPVGEPRPTAPLSTATTTTQRPTLRWALSAGASGAHVDVCRDRACAVVEQSFDAAGTAAAPPAQLAPGVHFWRLSGRAGGGTGSATGPVWELRVGHRSATTDASWGTFPDLNGDGYADVVVGSGDALGHVYVYSGGSTGPTATPATTITGPDGAGGYFGTSVASAGDVNGDGFTDLIVGAYNVAGITGRAYIYFGSATGLVPTPAITLSGPDGAGGYFGSSVAGAGDVNGDGFADVVVGAQNAMDGTGRAYVFAGSPTGLTAAPTATLTGTDGLNGYFGYSVGGAGDINADGYADLVVGAFGAMRSVGRTYVFLGGAGGLNRTPVTTLDGPDGGSFGWTVASAGDVNGDGFADVVVSAPTVTRNTGRAYVYFGSARGLVAEAARTLIGPGGEGGFFGQSLAAGGDVNGDGFGDLVVGAYAALSYSGQAYAYLGGAGGVGSSPSITVTSSAGAGGTFGSSLTNSGDVNRDGFSDLLVGSPAAMSQRGRVDVYFGGALGPGPTPSFTVNGPTLNGAFGYAIAAVGGLSLGRPRVGFLARSRALELL